MLPTHLPHRAKAMAPKAEQPVGKAASAAQPVSLPLRELNMRSGQFGSWAVVVQQAKVDEYEYLWEGKKELAIISRASSSRLKTPANTA